METFTLGFKKPRAKAFEIKICGKNTVSASELEAGYKVLCAEVKVIASRLI
jgi:hypothetical protein